MLPFLVLQYVAVVLSGLVAGSFATAVAWREMQETSWITNSKGAAARSCCKSCGHILSVLDLVPFFSWLFLKGRCRYCHEKIGAFYPLVEITTVLFFLAIFSAWGFSFQSLILMMAVPFFLVLFIVDVKTMILPDRVQAVLWGLGLFWAAAGCFSCDNLRDFSVVLAESVLNSLLFAVLIFIVSQAASKLLKKESMGFGDVKFFAVAGAWLTLEDLPLFLLLSGVSGVLFGSLWRLYVRQAVFPFGPALIIALSIIVTYRYGW